MTDDQTQEKKVDEYRKEAEEYLAGWKRAKADLVNYQKQVERERAEWFMYANAGCVKAMLPVLDSLEQSVIASVAKQSPEIATSPRDGGAPRDDIFEGVVKIRDQMVDVLRSMGVEAIKIIGEPVNLEFHEVVATEVSEEHAAGLIVKEAQRGYTMHGKVLRVAKVIVSE